MIIYWFRQDLRLSDNPALSDAASRGEEILPIYIHDDINAAEYKLGGATKWWLHQSLKALDSSLGGKLKLFAGPAEEVIAKLTKQHNIKAVFWNRCYQPWQIKRDSAVKSALEKQEIAAYSHNGSLLWEPWKITKDDGTNYKVFTPYYRKGCLNADLPRRPLKVPKLKLHEKVDIGFAKKLPELELMPKIGWYDGIAGRFSTGEAAAQKRLAEFVDDGLEGYKEGRNFPSKNNVSCLSPHLRFGEISPNQVWYAASERNYKKDVDHFLSELGWREFSYYLLYHYPKLPKQNLQSNFDNFPWQQNSKLLTAWQKGMTGYPIVDAGMRELWQTGYMHNRVRMIVGSFLVKNLLLDWRLGERWFWDCLVDADLASNSASWQWVAGCGADAAPYFRIFNPVLQGEKFDTDGSYTKKYVPELQNVPNKYLFKPWEAPADTLISSGVILGKDYPKPVVEPSNSRNNALEAYAKMKESNKG